MRRHLFGTIPIVAIVTLLAWLIAAPFAHAQYPGPQGPMMFSANCSGTPNFGTAYLCFDTTVNGFYYWLSGTGFQAISASQATAVFTEQAAPAGQASKEVLWGDSTAHTLKVKANNGSALYLVNDANTLASNAIPKGSGTNANIATSSITDDGTTVTTTDALTASGGSITAGSAGVTQGNLVLSGSTAGTFTLAPAANTTGSWTLTAKATAPAQGDLFTFSNGTGTMSTIADVATGSVLASQGTSTVPAYVTTGVFQSFLSGNANTTVSNSAANVFPMSGSGTPVATTSEGTVANASAVAGTLSNLECYLTTAAGTKTAAGGTNYVLAVRQNLSSSTLTCTIATAATNCTDTTAGHNVTIAVGDQLDFIDTPSGTPTALIPHCAVQFTF